MARGLGIQHNKRHADQRSPPGLRIFPDDMGSQGQRGELVRDIDRILCAAMEDGLFDEGAQRPSLMVEVAEFGGTQLD